MPIPIPQIDPSPALKPFPPSQNRSLSCPQSVPSTPIIRFPFRSLDVHVKEKVWVFGRIDDEKDSDDDLASNTDTDSSKPIIQGPLDSTLSLDDSKVRIGDSGSEVDRESVGSLEPLAALQEATQALARLDLTDKLSNAVAQSDSDRLNNAIAQSDSEMFGSPAEIEAASYSQRGWTFTNINIQLYAEITFNDY